MSIKQGGNTIAGAVGKYPLNERNISNCITNIPQDIKLELSSGTLTLKAGSKVYVPNGAGVFDEVAIESDLAISGSVNQQVFVFYSPTKPNNKYDYLNSAYICSGSTDSLAGVSPHCWYDTTNNLIKLFTDSSTTPARNVSFPLCLATLGNSGFISIDQVFNGFGYIGSTVFALPGVKGLIPDGRNADGTLKNIEFSVSNVLTANIGSYTGEVVWLLRSDDFSGSGYYAYDEKNNYNTHQGDFTNGCACVYSYTTNGVISNFNSKTAFHAVDYSEADFVVAFQKPTAENNYIWYRKYKSGWVEQGGVQNGSVNIAPGTEANLGTITLPIQMANSSYCALATGDGYTTLMNINLTRSSCIFVFGAYGSATRTLTYVCWQVSGMAA